MTGLDNIAEALGIYGVHEGFPRERLQMAGKLLSAGVTQDDIEVAGNSLRASKEPAAVPKILTAILNGPDAREVIADMRRLRDKRGEKFSAKFGDKPTVVRPLPDEDETEWDRNRRCLIAYCRHVSDRRSLAEVASELGVSLAALPAMIERGKVMSAPPPQVQPEKAQFVCSDAPQKSRQQKILELVEWAKKLPALKKPS